MVALLAEGVDRNACEHTLLSKKYEVALLAEGVDRNPVNSPPTAIPGRSPSSRRAWIEIGGQRLAAAHLKSPSSRRAWIEIRR